MNLEYAKANRRVGRAIFKQWLRDAQRKLSRFEAYLQKGDRILDVGAGPAAVSYLLKMQGANVTPLDVQDLSLSEEITPVIYDGQVMPFDDRSFDAALLLTVLHHTPNVEEVLMEAKRVSRRLIVIEDIYENWMQKQVTFFTDSLMNLEFSGHPHSNKNGRDWKRLFASLGLRLIHSRTDRFFLIFKQATYVLEC